MKKLIALAAVVAALVLPGSAQAWCWGETIEKGQYWYPTGTTFFYWWGYHVCMPPLDHGEGYWALFPTGGGGYELMSAL